MNGNELQSKMSQLPPIDKDKAPLHTWPRHQLSIRRHTAIDDPYSFLSWSTIVATMFVGSGAEFTRDEFNALDLRYRNILQEPYFGQPELMRVYGTTTSGNLIHQAYHLMQFEKSAKVKVEDLDSIVEFGGGYGAMALLCRRLGFIGKYTIIDLSEFSLLQEFYLFNTIGLQNIELVDSWDGSKMKADLLMAIYSLSEVSIDYRLHILNSIETKYHFLAHQDLYTLPSGQLVDNVEEFEKVAGRFNLKHWPNKVMKGHWYLS
jgi:hypothetical protein